MACCSKCVAACGCSRRQATVPAIAAGTHALPRRNGSLSITPTPLASLWFARSGPLGARPVFVRNPRRTGCAACAAAARCTRWPEHSIEVLGTMGVRTVGDCLRLPRDASRAASASSCLPRSTAATPAACKSRAQRMPRMNALRARRGLEPEIADTARLGLALDPLLEELCQFLRERSRWRAGDRSAVASPRCAVTRVRLRFVQPVGAQPRHMAELLRGARLAQLVLPQPVRNLRLLSGPLIDLQADAIELFAHDGANPARHLPQLASGCVRASATRPCTDSPACPSIDPRQGWRAVEPAATKPQGAKESVVTQRCTARESVLHAALISLGGVGRKTGRGGPAASGCSTGPSPATSGRLRFSKKARTHRIRLVGRHDVAA